jgi:hypothetical protein
MPHCLFSFDNRNKQINLRAYYKILLGLIIFVTIPAIECMIVMFRIDVIHLYDEGNYPFYAKDRYREIKCIEKIYLV